jgi:hypothetical protein
VQRRLHIKHAGWVEILASQRLDLASLYVSMGCFDGVLHAWVLRGGAGGVLTTETVRRRVEKDLQGDRGTQQELAATTVHLPETWSTEYRVRTAKDWRANLTTDMHLQHMLKECLNYMTAVVAAGIETGGAAAYVATCVKRDKELRGGWSLDRAEVDRLVAGIKSARPDKGAGRDEAAGEPERSRIRTLLDAMRRVMDEYGD